MYTSANKSIWSGRVDHADDCTSYRYHQVVTVETIEAMTGDKLNRQAILSFDCEEGVRRNHGRLGAAKGSYEIKKALSNLPCFELDIVDVGIVTCENNELEAAQRQLGNTVNELLQGNNQVIILGGGHETLYGHYLGVRQAYGTDTKIGLINIDAHFDLRAYDTEPSSGTMFNQILSEDEHANYFVIGIQKYGNTKQLFDRAEQFGVHYILEQDVIETEFSKIADAIHDFTNQQDVIILTLCMDVLAADAAPGVSAPSVFGLQPTIVRKIIQTVAKQHKNMSFDVCEVNPVFDQDNRTAKLAAAFVNEYIVHRPFK